MKGPDWFIDPYFLSPGSKSLLTLFGAEHILGGISGYNVAETTDKNPERVALLHSSRGLTFAMRSISTIQAGWQPGKIWRRVPIH